METKSTEQTHLNAIANAAKTIFKEGALAEQKKVLDTLNNALSAFNLIERMAQEQINRIEEAIRNLVDKEVD